MAQRQERDQTLSIRANSLIRLVAAVAALSLFAASGVLLIEAQGHARPLLQLPAALVTLALGAAVLHGGTLAVRGRRLSALALWSGCTGLLVILPFLQLLPIRYESAVLLDLKALAPPLWPYALAIPLLLFLALDLSLPRLGANGTSGLFLLLGLLSAITLLFFATALIGSVANHSTLILVPRRLFWIALAPVGLSGLIVLATVLSRRGVSREGLALLVITGLGIEWVATWSYDGPHFLSEAAQVPYPRFPLLPLLGGTLPGALAALAGVLGAWEVYVKGRGGPTPEHAVPRS